MAFSSSDSRDGISFTGGRTANTVGPFVLLGGKYLFGASAPSTSAILYVLMPDNTTYQAYGAGLTAAGFIIYDLPAGTYEIQLVATGDVQGFLQKVPYRPN